MSMFGELYQLALGATLTLTVSADEHSGKMTVNVIPKPKADHGEAALSTPLSLTATPDEFDANFVAVLSGYRSEHRSLSEQAEATKELLQAATKASQTKARGAVAKASGKPISQPAPAEDSAGGDEEVEAEGGQEVAAPAPAPQSALPAEPQLFG
jgi:PRTRC genetic system protein E